MALRYVTTAFFNKINIKLSASKSKGLLILTIFLETGFKSMQNKAQKISGLFRRNDEFFVGIFYCWIGSENF